jgi:carnitine 3-dehydrogenase
VSPSDSTSQPTQTAAVGGGLIGRSWAILFLAAGHSVAVYDPEPKAEGRLHEEMDQAWPVLQQLGLAADPRPTGEISFTGDARAAVEGATFVQESIPERLPLKHALYAEIEDVLLPDAIVSTSASGLTLSQLQTGWRDPSRFVLGHPFNPPHLIPLVEVMGNERTAPGVVDQARAFYEAAGKVTIEIRREVPGHVANRLQAALWREAISLVNEGVATVEDVDKAVSAGPGLRWAVMGPTQVFNLGGGEQGLAYYLAHFAESYHGWWDDLGDPRFDQATIDRLVAGVHDVVGDTPYAELTARRDEVLTKVVAAAHSRVNE